MRKKGRIQYVSPLEILAIHKRILDKTDGAQGIRDVGLFVSLTERPRTVVGGKEAYPDLFQKAAVYLESLVAYHVFLDGNKRTGLGTMARFLYVNGYAFKATNEESEQFVLRVATEKLALERIAEWIKAHSVERTV